MQIHNGAIILDNNFVRMTMTDILWNGWDKCTNLSVNHAQNYSLSPYKTTTFETPFPLFKTAKYFTIPVILKWSRHCMFRPTNEAEQIYGHEHGDVA
jgi:hypothetical protein